MRNHHAYSSIPFLHIKQCGICVSVMVDSVRTLACSHCFCQSCIEKYLVSERTSYVQGFANVVCPTCRQPGMMSEDPSRTELMVSELMVQFHKTSLRYVCFFEGCGLSFPGAELRDHVENCPSRLHTCTLIDANGKSWGHGCGQHVTRGNRHRCLLDCLNHLKDQNAKLECRNIELEKETEQSKKRRR